MTERLAPATELPAGLAAYRRTDVFTETTVPAGLLSAHSTKAGTWGLIRVVQGALRYRVIDERRTPRERILTVQDAAGVVEPQILHEVAPLGEVRFYVEFFR